MGLLDIDHRNFEADHINSHTPLQLIYSHFSQTDPDNIQEQFSTYTRIYHYGSLQIKTSLPSALKRPPMVKLSLSCLGGGRVMHLVNGLPHSLITENDRLSQSRENNQACHRFPHLTMSLPSIILRHAQQKMSSMLSI